MRKNRAHLRRRLSIFDAGSVIAAGSAIAGMYYGAKGNFEKFRSSVKKNNIKDNIRMVTNAGSPNRPLRRSSRIRNNRFNRTRTVSTPRVRASRSSSRRSMSIVRPPPYVFGSGQRAKPFNFRTVYKKRSVGRYGGLFKKPSRKRLTTFDKILSKGYVSHDEKGQVLLTTDHSAYFVHGTYPVSKVVYATGFAIVKKLALMSGIMFDSWTRILPWDMKLQVRFQLNDSTGTTGAVTFTKTPPNTWFDLATDLSTWFASTFGNLAADIQYLVKSFQLFQVFPSTSNEVLHAFIDGDVIDVHIITHTVTKIQNRTSAGVDSNEADDVDNVPLIGKIFSGRGTGFRLKYKSSTSTEALIIDPSTGYAVVESGDLGSSTYDEPPMTALLTQYKKYSGIKLAPGSIKSMIDSQRFRVNLNVLLKDNFYVVEQDVGLTTNVYIPRGHCKMLCLEKMLNCSDESLRFGIENSYKIGVYITVRKSVTAPLYSSQIITPP